MHHNVYIWTIININSLNILKNVLIERNGKHEFAQNILVAFENLKNGWKKKYENKWITNEHRITKKNFVIFSSYVCDGIWKMLTGTSEEDSEQNTNTMKNAMHAIERERDKNGKISIIITIKKTGRE